MEAWTKSRCRAKISSNKLTGKNPWHKPDSISEQMLYQMLYRLYAVVSINLHQPIHPQSYVDFPSGV